MAEIIDFSLDCLKEESTKVDRRRNPEPLTFPTSYGGVDIDNFLEYTMINELSIKSLNWLKDQHGNIIADKILQGIAIHDENKLKQLKQHEKEVKEGRGERVYAPMKEVIAKRLEKQKEVSFRFVSNITLHGVTPYDDSGEVDKKGQKPLFSWCNSYDDSNSTDDMWA